MIAPELSDRNRLANPAARLARAHRRQERSMARASKKSSARQRRLERRPERGIAREACFVAEDAQRSKVQNGSGEAM